MKTTVKNLSDTRVELTVSLDAADFKKPIEQAQAQLAKEVTVSGFRKGKAPLEKALPLINPADISSTALDLAIRSTVVKAFDEAKKQPIMIPEVNVTKFVPGESAEYTATADILPEVKLGDYKALKVKKETTKVSDKEIMEIIDNVAQAYAEKKVVKRAAKLTDEVIIDFTGKKDGVEFPGGKAKDYHLALGSGSFIPGFEEGIVGHEVGDKFDLELTFPADYHAPELAGAKTVFEVLVKQISEVVKPEYNEEFAKKCGDFKSMDEFKADVKKNLEAQNEHKNLEKYKDDLISALVKKSKVSAPEVMIHDQMRMIQDDVTRNAAQMGIDYEEYVKRSGKTQEEWDKEMHEVAELRVKSSLVLQILARDNKITVEDEIVDAKVAELQDVYKNSKEALANLKDPRVRMDIKNRLTIEKTIDFLVDANK